MAHRTLTRDEAEPLVRTGRLTVASLYEPSHCQDGSEFVYVQLTKNYTVFYRLRPIPTASKEVK